MNPEAQPPKTAKFPRKNAELRPREYLSKAEVEDLREGRYVTITIMPCAIARNAGHASALWPFTLYCHREIHLASKSHFLRILLFLLYLTHPQIILYSHNQ